ncbi:hypothetical protein [Mycobacterium sp.]
MSRATVYRVLSENAD